MPTLKISSEQKSIEKDLTPEVYTKYSLNSYTVSLRFLRKKKCWKVLQNMKNIFSGKKNVVK